METKITKRGELGPERYTERVMVLLTKTQAEKVKRIANEQYLSTGAVIRNEIISLIGRMTGAKGK